MVYLKYITNLHHRKYIDDCNAANNSNHTHTYLVATIPNSLMDTIFISLIANLVWEGQYIIKQIIVN